MSNLIQLLNNLGNVKNDISNFIKIETKDFYIIDIDGQSQISDTTVVDACFSVINEYSDDIYFIPIDGKNGLFGFGNSNCDAIIFNKEYFCFLEFKLNATSTKERAIRKNRKKAISQLSKTINYFDEKLEKDYCGLYLEAFVSTPTTYPRKDTAWMDLEVQFLEEYGIPLFETNEKEFK